MKLYLDRDERWPDYCASERPRWSGDRPVDAPDDLLERVRRAEEEYAAVQEILERLWKAAT